MRAAYSKHIHHSQPNNKVGVDARVHNRQPHKQQAASSKVGKCGTRSLCASGQGGSRAEPQPPLTVQLYIRHLDWRLYQDPSVAPSANLATAHCLTQWHPILAATWKIVVQMESSSDLAVIPGLGCHGRQRSGMGREEAPDRRR